MRMNGKLAAGLFGMACLAMAAMPSTAFAQGRQGGGGGGRGQGGAWGGRGGGGEVMQAQQVITALDGITDDEKTKIAAIVTDSQGQMREAMQGMQDLSPEDRAAKMKDIQKMQADTTDKMVAELTDAQKAVFPAKFSDAVVTRAQTTVTAMAKTAETFDTSDDNKAALKTLFADTTKKFDGFKTDAASVKDMAASRELNTKVNDTLTDVRKQVTTILGADDARTFQRDTMQNMPRQGRNGGGGGANGGGRRQTATPTTAPTL